MITTKNILKLITKTHKLNTSPICSSYILNKNTHYFSNSNDDNNNKSKIN